MKKKIFGALVVVAIAASAMINVNLNKVSDKGDLALANVEALADPEGEPTPTSWQIGDKTIVAETKITTEPGWQWSISLNVWLFEGKVSNGAPTTSVTTSSSTVKIKCCQPMGPETTCSYERC